MKTSKFTMKALRFVTIGSSHIFELHERSIFGLQILENAETTIFQGQQ